MRFTIFISSLSMVTILLVVAACTGSSAKTEKAKTNLTQAELVKRGDYLVNAIGCDDCHSPKSFGPKGPEIIEALRFSGYPSNREILKPDSNTIKSGWVLLNPDLTSAAGPWGVSYAANITSDDTGIGSWTEEQFLRSIREGKWKGLENSRPLLPPMPWQTYRNLSDEDLSAIFAYLKTTKPVANVVPAPRQVKDIK